MAFNGSCPQGEKRLASISLAALRTTRSNRRIPVTHGCSGWYNGLVRKVG
jgi:hypothetical protein